MMWKFQAGPQTQTQVFGNWEGHTRGIGSKLMVNMGYVKGAALGSREGALLDPIQVASHLFHVQYMYMTTSRPQ